MRRAKKSKAERAVHQGYRAGIRGRSDASCPYTQGHRGEWFSGYREGRRQYQQGFID